MKSYLKSQVVFIFKVLVFLILIAVSLGCSSQTSSTETSSTTSQTTITSAISSSVKTIQTTTTTKSTSTLTTLITSVPIILTSITIEPQIPEILDSGATQQFKATGYYSDGTTKDISSQVNWRSSGETIVTISSTGEVSNVAKMTMSEPILPTGISLTANVMITATFTGIRSKPVNLTVVKAPLKPLSSLDVFMKGIHFNDWKRFDAPNQWRGLFLPPKTDESLNILTNTGANWISITVIFGQETVSSTAMFRDSPATPTDVELRRVINLAHSFGLRVMLLPSLALSNDPNHWWGQIGTAFTSETQWQKWFESYSEILNHYASFAQESEVDMLCIGRELDGVTQREDEWRQIIKGVRELYNGLITYSSLSSGEYANIKWWDAVDYIGVNGYFLLTNSNDPTVSELKAAWINRGYIASLEYLSSQYNKSIVITEIGYISQDGANKVPGDFWINTPTDIQEQADCYQAAFEVFWEKPWLAGIFWWQWSATSAEWPESPQSKPAEEILKSFYLSQ